MRRVPDSLDAEALSDPHPGLPDGGGPVHPGAGPISAVGVPVKRGRRGRRRGASRSRLDTVPGAASTPAATSEPHFGTPAVETASPIG